MGITMNYGRIIKEEMYVGKRVRLDYTDDEWTKLKPGDEGEIVMVDDMGTLFVNWDAGSNLGLIPGKDKFTILDK